MNTPKIILVTSAACGLGRLVSQALAQGGHSVCAWVSPAAKGDARLAAGLADYAKHNGVDVRAMKADLRSQKSVDNAIAGILRDYGRIDVVVHNAEHTVPGPAEAFTPEQYADLYDLNVLSAQRVNRAVLPHMRGRGKGLLVWVSSSSVAGGALSYSAPYLATKAAMDAVAVQYARELARWGIETSIVVPGAFARSTGHLCLAGRPADEDRATEYEVGPYAGFGEQIEEAFARIVPEEANVGAVAGAIAEVVDTPPGERPFRLHVDPARDGAEVSFAVIDRVREEMLHRMGFSDLLKPRAPAAPPAMPGPMRVRSGPVHR